MTGGRHTPPSGDGRTLRWHPLALVPLALAAWVYHPIIRVFFFADDFYHLGRIVDGDGLAFLLAPFGGHNLLVRNLAFLASWQLFGLHSGAWYWTVLLTHLLNVWLLFGVLGALTGSAALACFGATLWGICPLALGTIGWCSVYGQAMVATILLVVLERLTRLAVADERVPTRTAWLWYVLLLAGTTCFGTGIGVALAFPVALFLLLPAAWRQPGVRVAYLVMPAVTLAVYFGLRHLAAWIEPLPFSEEVHRLAALSGLGYALVMLPSLLGFAAASSALGYLVDPERFPDPRTWATIAAFAIGLGVLAWRGDRKARRAALAMAALAVGVYAVIAVGRARVYSGFGVALARAAAEPRYHYVGTIPVVILLCLALQQIGRIGWLTAVPRSLLLAAGLGLAVAGYAQSSFRIEEHRGARNYLARATAEIATAVAASPAGSTVYLDNGKTQPVIGPWLDIFFPGRAALFLLLSPDDQLDGRHVRFVEPDPEVRKFWAARPKARLTMLLVASRPGAE